VLWSDEIATVNKHTTHIKNTFATISNRLTSVDQDLKSHTSEVCDVAATVESLLPPFANQLNGNSPCGGNLPAVFKESQDSHHEPQR